MARPKTPDDGRWRKPPAKIPGVRAVRRQDALGAYWVFVVRWTDPATKKTLAETCPTPQDALDFKAQLRLMRRRGVLADLDKGMEPLSEFAAKWLREHAATHLTRKTLRNYTATYNLHVHPHIGRMALRDIKPQTVDQLRSGLLAAGVGAPTVRKALAVLSSMLGQAVVWGKIDANPVRQVKKPAGRRRKVIEPLSVLQVEQLLHELRRLGDEDGAMLVQLMAYTGARPQDALALAYSEVTTRIHYAYKVVDGKRHEGAKTGADRSRSVEALPSLRRALLARRALLPGATGESLVVPAPDGGPWTDDRYKNWISKSARGTRRKDGQRTGQPGAFRRAAATIGLPTDVTPYSLRHTYASLRIAEQRLSLKEIAAEMGHSLQVLAETYAHVISEYAGGGAIDPEQLIKEARARVATGEVTGTTRLQTDSTGEAS